ncbi:MAG: hypothetical protein JXA99_01900 [Candidatus Lokiarchaeota archaeon]|nr:hypothetical protein [Candidatus Lokiarchaeota archaeon]
MKKIKEILENIKNWFIKNWFMIVNYLIIFSAYSIVYGKLDIASVLLGLWLFVSVAYAGYKWFIKKK